jgi:hypothetical protein
MSEVITLVVTLTSMVSVTTHQNQTTTFVMNSNDWLSCIQKSILEYRLNVPNTELVFSKAYSVYQSFNSSNFMLF